MVLPTSPAVLLLQYGPCGRNALGLRHLLLGLMQVVHLVVAAQCFELLSVALTPLPLLPVCRLSCWGLHQALLPGHSSAPACAVLGGEAGCAWSAGGSGPLSH